MNPQDFYLMQQTLEDQGILTVRLADKDGLRWAQQQIVEYHYLHNPVDVRCSPVAYHIQLFGEPVGCLIFGRPESTKCIGWYGGNEDIASGRCRISRWQILNLARMWLHPDLQPGGRFYHPQDILSPSILPGFYDRKYIWRSATASYAIEMVMGRLVYDYLFLKPPVWMDEPFQIAELISYCDRNVHRGVLYRGCRFQSVRINKRGIETFVRKPLRPLTESELAIIAQRSQEDQRCKKLRMGRIERESQQVLWDASIAS